MIDKIPVDPKTGVILDKSLLAQEIDAIFARHGFEKGPTVTREELRRMMLADGVRPEDNIGSRDIIRARYGCEDEE